MNGLDCGGNGARIFLERGQLVWNLESLLSVFNIIEADHINWM